MFDENGIWQDQIYPTAGPSGGATGALDLMNVMQSGQNYNQEHAAKMQYLLLKMLSDRNAQAAVNSPYAAQALEMKPEDVQSAYAQTPEGQFRSYAEANPDMTPEQAYQRQVSLGMVTPTSLGAYARASTMDEAKLQRLQLALEARYGKQVSDATIAYVRMGFSPQTALDMAQTTGTGTLAGQGATETAPVVQAEIENKGAHAKELEARSERESEQAKVTGPLAQSLISQRTANADLIRAKTASEKIKASVLQQTANGTKPMTDAQKVVAQRSLAAMDKMIHDAETKPLLSSQKKDAAFMKDRTDRITALKADRDAAAKLIEGQPASGPTTGKFRFNPATGDIE